MSARPARKSSKWIAGAFAEAPVTAVARRALQLRLAAVVETLPPAVKHADEDIEHVHQLRVATRRAAAALETFGDLLPKRRAKWIAKRLRHIRRAAGAARDLDVFAVRLAGLLAQNEEPRGRRLLKRLRRERSKAQIPICEVYHELRRDKFERRCQRLIRRVRRRDAASGLALAAETTSNGDHTGTAPAPSQTFAEAARVRLRPIVEGLFELTDVEHQPIEAWHRLRIEAKRLRYAMELFAGAFEPSFRQDAYPLVEQLQEHLGRINDHAGAAARLSAWKEEFDSLELAAWLSRQQTREEAACRECQRQFLADWPAARLAELERILQRHLSWAPPSQPLGRPAAAPPTLEPPAASDADIASA